MNTYGSKPVKRGPKRYLVLSLPSNFPYKIGRIGLFIALIIGTNIISHWIWNDRPIEAAIQEKSGSVKLYLAEKASTYVGDLDSFSEKVKQIAGQLKVPDAWLMAVMYAESKFDVGVLNYKGSGAVGLIQFMPQTARDLNVSVERLKRMNHTQQLEYVYLYLQKVRERNGEYDSLTDLYLAILYPKARKQDMCYTLYAKPTQAYKQNSGLDVDKDGRVTISDVDKHLKKMFPQAYIASIDS